MSWFFKAASAATLSLMFLGGSAYAQPADPAAVSAPSPSSHVSFTTTQGAILDGQSTSFNIDMKTGDYTITTDGGIAHFIMIRGKGTLTKSQLRSLRTALDKLDTAKTPKNLPGLVPGSGEFTISWDGKSTSGAVNVKGAIEDAKQNHQDVSAWKVVSPIMKKFQTLETKLEASYKPTLPAPDKKAPFDELSIEERNSWTGGVDKLTIKPDGTYTLERSLGQSTLTGTLTKAQLDRIIKAYDQNTLAADNGKQIGSYIPDDTLFTISAKENGKTYKVNGSVDAQNLGPLQALEKALVGDVNKLQPRVAHPLTATDSKDAKDESLMGKAKSFFDAAWAKVAGDRATAKASADVGADGRPSRSVGMSGLITDRVAAESSKADGKDVADEGK